LVKLRDWVLITVSAVVEAVFGGYE
jgi:hypothetical protein